MSHGWTVKPSKRNTILKENYGRIIKTQNHALKASYVVESNTTGSTHRIKYYFPALAQNHILRSSILPSSQPRTLSQVP